MTFPSLQDLIDVFLGDADWKQRVKPTIQMTSPDGNEFEAKWRGGPRTKEKKLGIFIYPKVRGNVVQDLDVNSTRYSLTIYFDGIDNDINARAFFAAASERGQWKVEHPVHGFMELQLISITENNEPVTSGGVTEINTEWIEPIDPATLQTARELAGIVDSLSTDHDLSAIDQFVNTVNETSETLNATITATTQGIQNVSDYLLSPLAATVDAIDNTFLTIQNSITDTLNATVLQPIALAGQIQQLIQLPLLANNDIVSRTETYQDYANEIISDLPTAANLKTKNQVGVQELALSASITAVAQIARTGITAALTQLPITSRAQAVEMATTVSDFFDTVTNALDNVQSNFDGSPIEKQYFSQSQSYSKAALLMAMTIKMLLLAAYDLKVERKFVLDRPRAPIEIAITEYGDLGENDINLDIFIASNNLKGKEILLLPAGREVLVYV